MKTFGAGTVVAAISILALSGCATISGIDEQQLPKSDWPIDLDVSQQEVAVEAAQTNPMAAGGGLLGVLIVSAVDKNRNQKAEDAVTELRDLLIDYPFGARFEQLLVESRVLETLSTDGPVSVLMQPRADYKTVPLAGKTFLVKPRVEFSNDLSNLNVMLLVAGQVPDEKGRPGKGSFVQIYQYVHPLSAPESGKKREDYAAVWLGYGKERLAGMIESGLRVSIEMLRADSVEGTRPLSETRIRVEDLAGPLPALFVVGGDDQTVWARARQANSRQYAFPVAAVRYREQAQQ